MVVGFLCLIIMEELFRVNVVMKLMLQETTTAKESTTGEYYTIIDSVNIGTLRSISHHVQCLNSQQLFYYIISLLKQKSNNNNKILAMDYVFDSLEVFFTG